MFKWLFIFTQFRWSVRMPPAGARSRVAVCRPFLLSLHEIEQTGGAREIESPWVGSRSIPEPYLAGGYVAGDSRGDGSVVRSLCSRQRTCDLDRAGFRPGSRPQGEVSGLDQLPGRSNYFIGNDPAKWRRNVAQFARVRYSNVYPGIDLVYHG